MTGSSPRSAMLALLATPPRHSDPAHSRAASAQPNCEVLQSAAFNNRDSSPRPTTHPGDILYWITCLGGAALLLIFSLR